MSKKIICFLGSERRSNREERRKARQDIKLGREPKRSYRTGRFWTD